MHPELRVGRLECPIPEDVEGGSPDDGPAALAFGGDRAYKLHSGTTSEYGRYVKSLGAPVTGSEGPRLPPFQTFSARDFRTYRKPPNFSPNYRLRIRPLFSTRTSRDTREAHTDSTSPEGRDLTRAPRATQTFPQRRQKAHLGQALVKHT